MKWWSIEVRDGVLPAQRWKDGYGETLLEALTRELREEGNIEMTGPPQLHGVFFAPENAERETVDLFTVVGTCLESQAATYMPVFVKLLASFSFDG